MKVINCAVLSQSQFSSRCLQELDEAGHQVNAVITQDMKVLTLCDDLMIDSVSDLSDLEMSSDYEYIFDPDCSIKNLSRINTIVVQPYLQAAADGHSPQLLWIAYRGDQAYELIAFQVSSDRLNDHKFLESVLVTLFQECITSLSRCPSLHHFSGFKSSSSQNLLYEGVKNQIDEWNNNQMDYPKEKTIIDCFQDRVESYRDRVAVSCDDRNLTYEDLNNRANNFAKKIRSSHLKKFGREITAEEIIAINITRSIDLIVALLGVLKAGVAYLPIDPKTPKKRIFRMLSEVNAVGLIADEKSDPVDIPDHLDSMLLYDIQDVQDTKHCADLTKINTSQNLAYVMFTSGSTGDAKAVMVEHRNLVASTYARFDAYSDTVKSFLMVSSISFDSSVAGIYWTLLSGGKLVIPSDRDADNLSRLASLIESHEISHLLCIPSLYNLLLDEPVESLSSLQNVIVAGEVCHLSVVDKHFDLLKSCHLINEYGPTEATVWSSFGYLEPGKNTIGKPIANTSLHILDEQYQTVNVGCVGELYIGGDGVTRGYFNRSDLNSQSFLDLPKIGRVYKTGDLVCWVKGELEYHGRADNQVKINGYRIETGEVESALANYEDLSESAVIAYGESGNKVLIAYCVPGMFTPEVTEIQSYLSEVLMSYMVPKYFVMMDSIPKLASGKLDRKSLPIPSFTPESRKRGIAHSSLETKLAGLWCRVLGLDQVGTHENFFDLGGHSLLAVRFVQLVSKELKLQFTMKDFLNHPTIHALAKWLETQDQMQEYWPTIVRDEEGRFDPFDLTSVQSAYWIGRSDSLKLGKVATHIYSEQDFDKLDIDRLEKTLNLLISRHEMLRMVVLPNGKQQVLPSVPEYRIKSRKLADQELNSSDSDWREELSHQVLDVTQWPLFDIRVSQYEGRDRLHMSMDALLFDALSLRIFLDEWASLYQNLSVPLKKVGLSFRDYMTSFQKLKKGPSYQRDKQYWLDRVDSLPIGPELPIAVQPEHIKSPQFVRQSQIIKTDTWAKVKEKAHHYKVTPTSVLLAAYSAVLSRWSKQPHFLLNLTIFNRFPLHPEVDQILGDFTSLQLLEIGRSGSAKSFSQLVKEVHNQLWQDMEHRLMDGIEIQREMIKKRGSDIIGRIAPVVFTSILNQPSENSHPFELPIEGHIEETFAISQTPQVWLDNKAYESEGSLVAEWDYVADLFPDNLILDMHRAYCQLIEELAVIDWSERIPQIMPESQIRMIEHTNDTRTELTLDLIHKPFQQQARLNPNKRAIVDQDGEMTYGELDEKSRILAARINQVAPNQPLIAVFMEKSADQVSACLGILEGGSAYLPLNIDWPATRVLDVLSTGQVETIITHDACYKFLSSTDFEQFNIINISDFNSWSSSQDYRTEASLDDTAYVIFTSGSTGNPKGVSISHRSASNTIEAVNNQYSISSSDAVLGLSKLSFDLSVWDIFGVLGRGGTLVLPDHDMQKDPTHWLDLLADYKVTVWNTVPMLKQMLLEHLSSLPKKPKDIGNIRLILMSGDVIPIDLPSHIKQYWPNASVISLGGATEGSIWSIWLDTAEVSSREQFIPYGKAMPNQRMYILDEHFEHKPDLVTGSIYIAGEGVAQCYFNNSEKTNASFFKHPTTNERLYKTGDLGYRRSDGTLVILGREDSQVKVGGHRIELGEVETAINSHSDIADVVVITSGDKRKKLQAFLTKQSDDCDLFQTEQRSSSNLTWCEIDKQASKVSSTFEMTDELVQSLLYMKEMEKSAPLIMMDGLQRLGLFTSVGETYQKDDLVYACEISPRYYKLFNQWVSSLVEAGYLVEDNDSMTCVRVPGSGECDRLLSELREQFADSLPVLLEYFESCQINHAKLFRGDEDALNLFMPGGSTKTMEYMYRESDLAKYYNSIVESVFETAIQGLQGREIKVLELGAGIGGTTKGILPLFSGEQVEYDYTDLSTFFFKNVEKEFSEYSFINYSLVDINKPFQFQGLKNQSYDIVLAASVIHNAPHVSETLEYIKQVLNPGGLLILIEGTENCALQKLNIGFIEGLNEFDDERRKTNLPLLSAEEWSHKMEEVGFQRVASYGHELGAEGLSQQRILVAQKGNTEDVFSSTKLKSYLSTKLPSYMVPDDYFILQKMPLSANGKVDRNALRQCSDNHRDLSHNNYIAPRTEFEHALVDAWQRSLSTSSIGINDNFFELGGDSIHAIQVVAQLREKGYELELAAVFSQPTLSKLALQMKYQLEIESNDSETVREDDMNAILGMMEVSHA